LGGTHLGRPSKTKGIGERKGNVEASLKMRYLSESLEVILHKIKTSPSIFLFLDYDGTLTSIAKRPPLASLENRDRQLLKELSRIPKITLGVMSGRALGDVKGLVSIHGIYYSGNHGLEIEGPGLHYTHPLPKDYLGLLTKIKGFLKKEFSGIKGVNIEDKGLTLSIHYRECKEADARRVKRRLEDILRPFLGNQLKKTLGKKVIDIRPNVKWDKGRALLKLLKIHHAFPIYIGDDVTDEDAFRAIKDTGISILVGGPKKSSCASYYVRDSNELYEFLRTMLRWMGEEKRCQGEKQKGNSPFTPP
jgi:trehalose-phosphatase